MLVSTGYNFDVDLCQVKINLNDLNLEPTVKHVKIRIRDQLNNKNFHTMLILHSLEYIIEKTTKSEQQLHDKDDLANNYHREK